MRPFDVLGVTERGRGDARPHGAEVIGDEAAAAALWEELARHQETTHRLASDAIQTLVHRILISIAVLTRTRTWRVAQFLDRTYHRHSRPDLSARLIALSSTVQRLAAASTAPSPDADSIRVSINAFQDALGDVVSSKPLRTARKITALLAAARFKTPEADMVERAALIGASLTTVSNAVAVPKPPLLLLETSASPLDFVAPRGDPLVTIVIPVGNQSIHTFTCLRAIRGQTTGVDYEVLLVADGADDETTTVLEQARGIRVIRYARNEDFAAACRSAAAEARGRYLVFLHDDTVVCQGWLSALLDAFHTDPQAGLVGAKLLSPDGKLLEAGGIVGQDGSAWNFGKTDDPHRPQYNYMRQVDYCSAACMAIARDLFLSGGGFDPRFSLASYQDADLAFRVRGMGKKVLYQPKAEVVHLEEAAAGAGPSVGGERYQAINQETFREKWSGVLTDHQRRGTETWKEPDRYVRGRVLVIDWTVPGIDRDSASIRLFNILERLRELGYKVTLIPDDLVPASPYAGRLQSTGVEVLFAPYIADIRSFLKANASRYDVILLSRVDVGGKYIETVKRSAPNSFIIFDTEHLHFVRIQREAALRGDEEMLRQAEDVRRRECTVASLADLTLVVSAAERETLLHQLPGAKVEVLSNIHEAHGSSRPFKARRDIMFIGRLAHPQNEDAVSYFLDAIWPAVRSEVPEARFFVVGESPPDDKQWSREANVVVTGWVPDAAEFFHHCRLSVVPLRFGAGVKGKITQSMSYGVPVVATPVAVEGMHLVDGESVLVAPAAADFARAVVRLYTDERLWAKLSANGLETIEQNFSVGAARSALERILQKASAVSMSHSR